MHNAPALLVLQSEITTPWSSLSALCNAARRAPVKNHNGVTLCASSLFIVRLSLALAAQRQERLPLCISRAKPAASINFYSYLICDAS